MSKDFKPAQIDSWVNQEFPKQTTREEIEKRIKCERMMVDFGEERGSPYPNSTEAHRRLLAKLEAKLAEIV